MAELKKDQKPKKTISKRLMPDQVAYSRIETMPGRQAQVDLAAFKITEPSGRTSTVYLFLMLLSYCRAMYGEFVQRCTLEIFLDCHKRAFHYLGGVPDEVLYDNMKVKSNINLQHLAQHFGFTSKVCPPWVKAKVELSVDYIHESFWRGYGFNSIEQANRDLFSWLDTVANTRVHGTHRQLIAERWQQEKASLRKLPAPETFLIFD
jgi:transposase